MLLLGMFAIAQSQNAATLEDRPSPGPAIEPPGLPDLARVGDTVVPAVAMPTPRNVYREAAGDLASGVADIPPRVYVPNEMSNTVSVIDAVTFKVIRTINVGSHPQHVTPDWDLSRLYVNDTGLTEIDARTGAVVRTITVAMPYNLYFTPDGARAIVVAEDLKRLDFYERATWRFLQSIPIPWAGVDHLDFSADGSYLVATTEYSGKVVKVDLESMTVAGTIDVGGFPIDVRLSPLGDLFYVTNQARHGVSIIDGVGMREVGFINTARGAHGLAISRDATRLYVSNRLAATITVIDVASSHLVTSWSVTGSPDMLQVSPDGRQLWTGNRFANTVTVIDTGSGAVVATIPVGRAPHGLTYFPQPGRISLGHNGVYR
jgi:YVTN family beta-propeller protein